MIGTLRAAAALLILLPTTNMARADGDPARGETRFQDCAACHKQFIDQEVNRVGWVQLQNQYDNWAASHWNHKGDPLKTVECRECHMPLVDSIDPAAGDDADYNRRRNDHKHRSHRFIASNQLMPKALKLEGWEQQLALTERWLQGKLDVPEISTPASSIVVTKVCRSMCGWIRAMVIPGCS